MNNEQRWKQRFQNFAKAYQVFLRRVEEYQTDPHSEAFQMALIQSFEIVQELSWKTVKDYLENEGYAKLKTPKDVIRQAFQSELITDAEAWMKSIENRNLTSHTYDEKILYKVLTHISDEFHSIVKDLHCQLKQEQ